MKVKKLSGAVIGALGAGALAIANVPAAMAQQPAAPAAKERIEVTGSNIKRVEGETSLPVTVITRQEIDRSGATSAMELLQLISSNNSAGATALISTIGATTFSNQTANLRGLQGGRTLVLINGKRVNSFAGEVNGNAGVNLAVIPFAAIERVEILKDGASAVYGSDAIAGVINFIVRSDYRGAEATVWYGKPTRSGGGGQEKYAASAGFGDLNTNRYNVFLSGSFDHQKPLMQKDRDFSRTAIDLPLGYFTASSNTFPGRITTGGIGVPGAPNNCAPSTFVPELGGCYYDPAAQEGVESIPEDKNTNFFGSLKFQITNSWQAYGTALYSKDENRYIIQPVPISNLFPIDAIGTPGTILIRPSSPFYPTALATAAGVNGQPLNVRYRSVLTGNRDQTDTNEGYQFVGGLKGSIGEWDLDVSANHSEGKLKNVLNGGYPLNSRIVPLLNSGRVNLFGPNTPDIVSEVQATNFKGETDNSKSTNQGVQAKISGEILQMAAGSLALAVGAEGRKEKLVQHYNPVLQTADVSGFGSNFLDLDASRDVKAAYAELNVPIFKTLEANVAVRTDDYSDFGRTTNPKASLRWQPSRDILFRGSYGKGFLAPTLFQLYVPNTIGTSQTGVSDPVRCPITHDTGLDCNTQFTVTFGGNRNLQPEKSENATLGLVFEPTNAFSISFDYFKIRLKGAIVNGVPIETVLADQVTYGGLITRAAPDANFPNLPGRISNVLQTFANLTDTHIEGVDVEGHYKWPRQGWGRLRLDLSGTYFIRNDSQQLDGSYAGFVANTFQSNVVGVIPRWKHYASLGWDSGPWQVNFAQTYQSSYVDAQTDGNNDLRRVSSMSLFDVQGQYTGFRHLTLTLGVKNVFDTNPPQTNQGNSFQALYDPSYYDARARFVYGSIRYEFK